MDGTALAGAVSSALASTVKIAEKAYEIRAVDEQAKGLLKTVDQVSHQLRDAKKLRSRKSALFTIVEQRMFDQTFGYTEEAIANVAALVEPARVDLEVTGGRVRFKTRVMFVLRDSPRILVCLTQLGIASQSLNRDLVTLCGREGRVVVGTDGGNTNTWSSSEKPVASKPDLPTYEESMSILAEQRMRNIRRRESAMSMSSIRPQTLSVISTPGSFPAEPIPETTAEATPISEHPTPVPRIVISSRFANNDSSDSEQSVRMRQAGGGRNRSLRWLESQSRSD